MSRLRRFWGVQFGVLATTVKFACGLGANVAAASTPAFAAAHRGLSGERAENTLAAFQAAIDAGFLAFELDLRITRDGEVIALHDDGMERTTAGSGRISDMDYDEVRSHMTADGPIPRLDDLFSALSSWQGLWNLEIKAHAAVAPALQLVEHHNLSDRVQISSFDPKALEIARDHAPTVSRALIVAGAIDEADLAAARKAKCNWLNLDKTYITSEVAAELMAQGFKLAAWTVNDPNQAIALVKLGVQCIITDVRSVAEALPADAKRPPRFS